jgi:hypothetical protein
VQLHPNFTELIFFFRVMALYKLLFFEIVRTYPILPLMRFQWNFTGLTSSSSPCIFCTGFTFEWFFESYDPWIKLVLWLLIIFMLPATQKLVQTSPRKLLLQFHLNILGRISTKSWCAYRLVILVNEFYVWIFSGLLFLYD